MRSSEWKKQKENNAQETMQNGGANLNHAKQKQVNKNNLKDRRKKDAINHRTQTYKEYIKT
jgi:hypothetical protein